MKGPPILVRAIPPIGVVPVLCTLFVNHPPYPSYSGSSTVPYPCHSIPNHPSHPFSSPPARIAAPGDKDHTGRNACGFGLLEPHFESYYAAISPARFGGSCGSCIAVRGATGRTLVVKVVDLCAGCKPNDVDFSTAVSVPPPLAPFSRGAFHWG